ncbi:MAG TPA: Flp family type IVb pilin [Nocardioidaceae bacterium]|nr:Flp family type IVb pilin [Nocardioidaceae bacterium]
MLSSLRYVGIVLAGINAKRKSEAGATAVEYGLLVALIAAAIIGVVFTLGGNLSGLFTNIGNEIATPDGIDN